MKQDISYPRRIRVSARQSALESNQRSLLRCDMEQAEARKAKSKSKQERKEERKKQAAIAREQESS